MLIDPSEYEESECIPKKNRLHICPGCLGKLSGDKEPYTDSKGTCYRERHCLRCGAVFTTDQPRERITSWRMSLTVQAQPQTRDKASPTILAARHGSSSSAVRQRTYREWQYALPGSSS